MRRLTFSSVPYTLIGSAEEGKGSRCHITAYATVLDAIE